MVKTCAVICALYAWCALDNTAKFTLEIYTVFAWCALVGEFWSVDTPFETNGDFTIVVEYIKITMPPLPPVT
jgi:hypothetical protein